jgi:hypothetical protein
MVLAGLCSSLALAALALVWAWIRLSRLERVMARIRSAASLSAAEEMLARQADDLGELQARVSDVALRVDHVTRLLAGCVQHVGIVRYDAFDDVGGRQSFSLAMLDGQRSGVVVSGIYSRSEVRLYAKQVDQGRASLALTAEESSAVSQALGAAPR